MNRLFHKMKKSDSIPERPNPAAHKTAETVPENVHNRLEAEVRKRTAELEEALNALKKQMVAGKDLENQFRQWSRVFMDAADPIVIEDLSGIIVDLNREAEREYGWRRNELIGKSIRSLIPPSHYHLADQLRERCRRGELVRNWENRRQNQNGRVFSVLLTAFPLMDESGKITSVATIAKDITLRKQTERELENSQRYLRELSRKSIEVLENDRRTIARELHDSIGASLAAMRFRLEGLIEEVAQDPGLVVDSLGETIAYLQSIIKETKQVSARLRPTILDDLGLMSTIEWYTRQLMDTSPDVRLNCRIDIREDGVPEPLKILIYRALQESLQNAVRHSKATKINLGLTGDANRIVLEISDNGCGFDAQKTLSRQNPFSGYGLASMIERAELVGGSFTLLSSVGGGTRIKMILPLAVPVSGSTRPNPI